MQIVDVKISELRPYAKNARVHPAKQIDLLVKNIEKFGFTTPVLVSKEKEIIAGHGRVLALKKLGKTDVPCVFMESLTEGEIKTLRLSDNQIAALGDWDMNLALEDLKELTPEMFDLTGFDSDLLIEPDEKDDEIPENVPARSKLGDLYELGQHRVLCGDSTQQEAVLKLMDGKKIGEKFIT